MSEFNTLAELAKKRRLREEKQKLSEAKSMELPGVKFELVGFGKDSNGNSVVKLKNGRGKGFSIQTNQQGDFQKLHSLRGYKAKDLDQDQLGMIAKTVSEYIKEYGTKTMKEGLDEKKISSKDTLDLVNRIAKLSEDIMKMNKGNKEDFGDDLEDARNSLVKARLAVEKAHDALK